MGYYTGIKDEGEDEFSFPVGQFTGKDSRVIKAEEKAALMGRQERLDALAASIGTTKYILLLAKRLDEGDVITRPYPDDRIVVTHPRFGMEMVTSQRAIDEAQALLPRLIGLVWPQ